MEIKISLIIPVYNMEKYLGRCLDSVIQQTEPFNEIIIVNDGSTDSSLAICERYAAAYKKIQIINKGNEGQATARNVGMKYSEGDYIMFLDSDDWIRQDTVALLKKQLVNTKLDVVYFDAEVVYEKGIEKKIGSPYDRSDANLDGKIMTGMEYFHNCYPINYIVSPCLAIYKKELMEKTGIRFPESLRSYEDNYFSFVFFQHAQQVMHISEKLYYRLYRANSTMTSAFSERKLKDYIKCVLLIWNKISLYKQEKELCYFVASYLRETMLYYDRCQKNEILLGSEAQDLLLNIVNKYLDFLHIIKFPDELSLLEVRICVRVLAKLVDRQFITRDMVEVIFEQAHAVQKEHYRDILKELPLNDSSLKIGIYGTGKHTEGLLDLYEKLIAPITCNLVFVDSIRDNEFYKDKPLINYKKLDESFDLIVISSFLYNEDMKNNVKTMNLHAKMINFYDTVTEDIFSNTFL